ncbi:SDR family NAD(P)-dependent oxidoreductase [Microbacterium sp. Leaf159]|uniref:SDR family NAD(P)-dependent oxidoreductase n=1 Tax=Microbacterium sp. Leaf159 TaxID=1736279 RepID=UPI0006FC7445|nr:SDR family oxidoreductase [Microbacterium sp. Leaf159]KQR37430.1 oxidoreductase [Microbacterium sp. Leaf159]
MALDLRGGTALITGASSGLGVEFARRFAARGSNLVLVARRVDRLEQLATELRTAAGVEVDVVPADLGVPGAAAALHREIAERGIRITSLVNNAGFGSHVAFDHADPARMTGEIQLNVLTLVELSRAFLPQLLQGQGALVTVASTAAYQPTPGMAVYGATKAFVLSFTEALWAEARGTGLRVLAVSPGSTKTEFFDVVGTEAASVGRQQTAGQVIDTAFRELDRANGKPSVVSGVRNHLLALGTRLLSRRALAQTSARLLGDVRLGGAEKVASGADRL